MHTSHSEQWCALIGFQGKSHFFHPLTSSIGKSLGGSTSEVTIPGSHKLALKWETEDKYPSPLNIKNRKVPIFVKGTTLIILLSITGSSNQ